MLIYLSFYVDYKVEITMTSLLGSFVGLAFNAGSNPVAIAGLVPLVAAGLTFIRYWNYDPETHPTNVETVSAPKEFQQKIYSNGFN